MRSGLFPHEYRLINGSLGDPSVYLFLPTLARAMLFDLGLLDAISNKELLKVSHVFISHTHIDHFIGFDRLLRVNIPHFRRISLYGPAGITQNVAGKLKGYTWNLLEPGQIVFDVAEIHDDGSLARARVSNDSAFEPIPTVARQPLKDGMIIEEFDDQSYVTAMAFDHGTSSMAYRFHSPRRFQVKAELLTERGWQPGPWIRELQIAMGQEARDTAITPANGISMSAGELADLLLIEHVPFSVGYLTDLGFTRSNISRCRSLMKGATLLLCEATFADEDLIRAVAKKHLTSRQAALLAATAGAQKLDIHHVSGIYGEDAEKVCREAADSFAAFRRMDPLELEGTILAELERISHLKV